MSNLSKRESIIKKYFSEFEEEIDFDICTFSGKLRSKGCELSYEELKEIIVIHRSGKNFEMRKEVFYEEDDYLGVISMYGNVNGRYNVEPLYVESMRNRIWTP